MKGIFEKMNEEKKTAEQGATQDAEQNVEQNAGQNAGQSVSQNSPQGNGQNAGNPASGAAEPLCRDGEAIEEKKVTKKDFAKLKKEWESSKKELTKVRKELEDQKKLTDASNDRYVRMMAEYENFRKRAASEKDAIYNNALTDVLTQILPLADALEMALKFGGNGEQVTKGIEMTLTKLSEILEKLGVAPIETKTFDPNFHNAVMHVEDNQFGEGEIVEVFQKGYKKGDKIIRYAMVKVAN